MCIRSPVGYAEEENMGRAEIGFGAWSRWRTGVAAVVLVLGGCAEPGHESGAADALAGWSAPVASSSTLFVDRINDSNDGVCTSDGRSWGDCNLRAAVAAASGLSGPVEIRLAVDSLVDQGEIVVPARPGRLSIVAAEGRAISGTDSSRLFRVEAGATLLLRGVHVTHFRAYTGGAIASHGQLELDGAVFADNHASCSGVGAMTAFASCSGGAIASSGQLTLWGGTRFENNLVTAEAYTAMYTTSWSSGGAIATSGVLLVDGEVTFSGNAASATSVSGVHPFPIGDAWATAAGGAIYSGGGRVVFTDRATGKCRFAGNAALAAATGIQSAPGTATSTGGAIHAHGELEMAPDACSFADNHAATEPDVYSESPRLAPRFGAHLDEATQAIVFTSTESPTWVDLHLDIDGERTTNVRMRPGPNGSFLAGPLALRAGDVLTYSFTYFAGGQGHDTFRFTRVVPLTFEPTAFRPEVRAYLTQGAYLVRLIADAPVAWADVHYSVNGGAPVNLRLDDVGGALGHALALGPDDELDYWITYAVGDTVLETGVYHFQPSVPGAETLWAHGFPGDDPDDPAHVPEGCWASDGWYTCATHAFSRVHAEDDVRFAGDAALVPFEIVGTGPFGTSLVKIAHVAFTGATAPGTGVGLVQLPASAAAPGLPPIDAADRDRGKFVSRAWSLRASYVLGGEGLSVALVDVNGLRSHAVDLVAHRSTYCRYGCSLEVPVALLADGTDVDLAQIRYIELRTSSGVAADPDLVIGHIRFDDLAF